MAYKINKTTGELTRLSKHRFISEGHHLNSPQKILANNPQIFTDLNELELGDVNIPFIIRELNTSRGPIDIIYITSNADIVLVETKLLRNPESHRVVVAQCIDYVKALTKINSDDIIDKAKQSKYSDKNFIADDYFISALKKNLSTGNFKVVIAGDLIHPNILEMVDSIQSAPHLSFTIILVELNAEINAEDEIYLNPRCISKTVEIERSVIRLEITEAGKVSSIDSEVPEKDRKGSKPILTEEDYLNNLEKPEFAPVIREFWKEWKDNGGDRNMGTVGFSAGKVIGGRRVPVQFVMQNSLDIISQKWREKYEIPQELYARYMNYFKEKVPEIYDSYIIGGKVVIKYQDLDIEEFKTILWGAFEIIR